MLLDLLRTLEHLNGDIHACFLLKLSIARGAFDGVGDKPVTIVEERHGAEVKESAVININGVLLHRIRKSCCFIYPDKVEALL